jgi:hypothetical protein
MQYKATSHIKHNADNYYAGDLLDLSTEEARQLLEVGAVEPVDLPFAKQLNTPWGDQP